MKKPILTFFLTGIISLLGLAQSVTFVADINSAPRSSNPKNSVVFNNKLYLATGESEQWLHVYLGKNEGAAFAKAPGVTGEYGSTGRDPKNFIVFNNKLYFNGFTTYKGEELVSYDGVNAPELVADINTTGQNGSNPANFTIFNNKLYFTANNGTNGEELYVYDGINPPSLVTDIWAGTSNSSPKFLTVFNNKLYFSAADAYLAYELWSYDGVNTPVKHDLWAGGNSNPTSLCIYKDTLYFAAQTTNAYNPKLHKLIGDTAYMITEINNPTYTYRYPASLTVLGNTLYMVANDAANHTEIFKYDGINPPTLVTDIYPGNFGSLPMELVKYNRESGDMIIFRARTPENGYELFGLEEGGQASLIQDIYPGVKQSYPSNFTTFNGGLFFTATDSLFGTELYSMGENLTVNLVNDFVGGTLNSNPKNLVEYNGKMFFNATTESDGSELWMIDGANPPTMVADFHSGTPGLNPSQPIVYHNKLYFTGQVNFYNNLREVFQYDGTGLPKQVTHIRSNAFGGRPENPIIFKDKLYFQADGQTHGFELYWFDEANDTAIEVADINTNPNGGGVYGEMAVFNNKLYFQGTGTDGDVELWAYDGINTPTKITDINPGTAASRPAYLTVFKNKLFFAAVDGTNTSRTSLFSYDGTNAPIKITDNSLWAMLYLNVHGDHLYFQSWEGSNQPELYKYDGTNAPVKIAVNSGGNPSNPIYFKSYNGKLYFQAQDNGYDAELFSYDGTSVVKYDLSNTWASNPKETFGYFNKIYVSAEGNNELGVELWSIDAPKTSTGAIKEINKTATAFPNPTQDKVHINMGNSTPEKITILSTTGQTLNVATTTTTADLSSLPAGVYILQIETKTEVGFVKIFRK